MNNPSICRRSATDRRALQSRATDEEGNVQPTREKLVAERGNKAFYHCNAITTWNVSRTGEVKHVYA